MAYHPFRNLSLKFVSTVVAALLWLVVAGERVVERVMRAPVEFQNLPAGLEIVGSPPDTIEIRLRGSSGALSRMTAGDVLVIDSREHRTQAQNREAARARLYALVEQAGRRPKRRRPTRPKAAAREQRLSAKKRRGAVKQLRGRSRSHDD